MNKYEKGGDTPPSLSTYTYLASSLYMLCFLRVLSVSTSLAYFHERRSLNNFHRDRVITFEQIAE
ncbi:hypothetical protein C9E20_25915 [Escherichia coli]|nr:hypothetical protein [Escherichia coli]PSZ71228.1 hypothetical protein C9E28_19000 [Escherichia coli]PSZ75931.1 hypothetical protein C9E20_25915 [Escherichia coli]PTA13576.1 hypothetical protein C9E26_20230 [Escherichia coli]